MMNGVEGDMVFAGGSCKLRKRKLSLWSVTRVAIAAKVQCVERVDVKGGD